MNVRGLHPADLQRLFVAETIALCASNLLAGGFNFAMECQRCQPELTWLADTDTPSDSLSVTA